MTDGTAAYAGQLRNLEAQAFRTRSALADFGELPAAMNERQHTATGSIDPYANGTSGDRTVRQRLDAIEQMLFVLARAQGGDPTAAG
ncbi:hypothetical protein [Streptomyces sp. IBSBF 2435]|uniref:hypothetical protein n=1 Tax=Streptomyces sp. IBSBF 2435 TaxID=2903531 RepID=UPI002FDC7398